MRGRDALLAHRAQLLRRPDIHGPVLDPLESAIRDGKAVIVPRWTLPDWMAEQIPGGHRDELLRIDGAGTITPYIRGGRQ